MPDLTSATPAGHLGPAIRDEFRSWEQMRHFLADRSGGPGFDADRALRQLLHVELAHRLDAGGGDVPGTAPAELTAMLRKVVDERPQPLNPRHRCPR